MAQQVKGLVAKPDTLRSIPTRMKEGENQFSSVFLRSLLVYHDEDRQTDRGEREREY